METWSEWSRIPDSADPDFRIIPKERTFKVSNIILPDQVLPSVSFKL